MEEDGGNEGARGEDGSIAILKLDSKAAEELGMDGRK
jgi:hypothetical protein